MKQEKQKTVTQKQQSVKKGGLPEKQKISKRTADLAGMAIIILLGIIAYSNSFNCSFHLDDSYNIVENGLIRNLWDVKSWMSFYPTRPVSVFTFALNYHFNELDVRYWHFLNLTIHLINACLVWWLVLLIFSSPVLKNYEIVKHKKMLALFVALLFVSHPLATQSVTYIVQRMASLAALFYLLSLALYIKGRLADKSNNYRYLLFGGSLISAFLALFSKENAYTLPFAILLTEIFFLQTKKLREYLKDYRLYLVIAGIIVLVIIFLWKFTFSIFKPAHLTAGTTITSLHYLFTQFAVIVKYIQLLIFPIQQNLDYDFPVSHGFFEIRTLLSFLFLLSLFVLGIFLFKKNRIISFGIFWFFLTLSIESSIIPIDDVIFEHRTYLPSFGFFLILGSLVYALLWNKNKNFMVGLLLVIIGLNLVFTYERNKVWKDELTLWSDVVMKSPEKARPHINRGNAYAVMGISDKALDDYSKAIHLDPYDALAFYNRGVYFKEMGELDKALSDLNKAIQINPKYTDAYFNRGAVYGSLGKWEQALADYSEGLKYDPENADLYSSRGVVYGNLGQWDKAIAEYTKSIEINPMNADTWSNRGATYSSKGLNEKAIADFSKAIEINPKHEAAYTNRGFIYGRLGQWDKAIADYTKALEIDPNNNIALEQREQAYANVNSEKK